MVSPVGCRSLGSSGGGAFQRGRLVWRIATLARVYGRTANVPQIADLTQKFALPGDERPAPLALDRRRLWAFDLLAFNGRDLRAQPLVKRQACLQVLLERFGSPAVSLSEPFEDGQALLRVAEQRGHEGVVSKRRDAPYRSGECRDWRRLA